MKKREIELVEDLTSCLTRINSKLKLLNLLTEAKIEYDKNNYENCKKACEEVLKDNPNNPIALRGLGCVAQIAGDFGLALEYYQKAFETSEKKEIELTLIGSLYYLQDDFDNAIAYFNKAIDINDDYDMAYDGRNQAMLENHLKIADLQDDLIKRKIL